MQKKKLCFYILTICLALSTNLSLAQVGSPEVVPPSPEAISMIQYGNSHVNYYTGQPALSIPIHNISVRGFQFPVNLGYSGFQGINVESIAPWVGLGWSLNATGMVSRTIRDLPDDEITKGSGYLQLPEPDLSDIVDLQGYLDGNKDKEPDKFYYSVNGLSGYFFLGKDGNVIQKKPGNIKISFTRTSEIDEFHIRDSNGYLYTFADKERTFALGPGQVPVDVPNKPTSWYLSSIKGPNDNLLLSFNYHDLLNLEHTTYAPHVAKEDLQIFQAQTDIRYIRHNTSAKRISEISYPGGKITFQLSNSTRQDYLNDKYLKEIRILSSANDSSSVIKRFKFSYSYFDKDGISSIDDTVNNVFLNGVNVGDYHKRLKLDQIQEWDDSGLNSLPPFVFDYHPGNLPHRYSFAKDHWGFYNGEDLNDSPEPEYKVLYYTQGLGVINTNLRSIGTANREPNAQFAKYAVLNRITYPSGGSTQFNLEGNTVESNELPNNKVQQSFNLNIDGSQSANFNVELSVEPFTILNISGALAHQACDIVASVYDSATSELLLNFNVPYNTAGLYSHTKEVNLQPGTYYMTLNYAGACTYNDARDQLSVSFEKELETHNKPFGGLRVSSIVDHDGISNQNDITRFFYYGENGSEGYTSGRAVSIPKYAYQRIAPNSSAIAPNEFSPYGLIRSLSSLYPLTTTSSSYVGYGKVTVVTGNEEITGKTVYEFTTPSDFPDFKDGYYNNPLSGENLLDTPSGKFEMYPFAEYDDKDYLRGLELKRTLYRWESGQFYKVSSIENVYAKTYNFPQNNGDELNQVFLLFDFSANTSFRSITGYKFDVHSKELPSDPTTFTFKKYNIYVGRLDLYKTIVRQYSQTSPSEFIETQTEHFWDDLDLGSGYYNISRSQTTDSNGRLLESRRYFVYDSLLHQDSIVRDYMLSRNMTNVLLEEESFKDSILINKTRNVYNNGVSKYLTNQVQIAKGTNNLETRLRYHKYDAFGNPLEVSKEDGMHICYIWGYNNTLPVAKIENATYSQIEDLELNFNLGDSGLTLTQETSLRSLPKAFVTTMTYQPGVGMLKSTDPNNITITYEYDSFGRLKLVRDSDNNIVKTYTYGFKSQ